MSAAAGPGAGDVTYTYSTTLSQPLEHAAGALENAITLTGVTVQVTDSDSDTLPVSFNVTIVDDVPQAVADTAAAAEDTAVTYNVITNADGTSDLQAPMRRRRDGGDAGDGWRGDGRVPPNGTITARLRRVLRALRYQLHDHRPGRRNSSSTVTVTVGDGFCSERGVDDQPDG